MNSSDRAKVNGKSLCKKKTEMNSQPHLANFPVTRKKIRNIFKEEKEENEMAETSKGSQHQFLFMLMVPTASVLLLLIVGIPLGFGIGNTEALQIEDEDLRRFSQDLLNSDTNVASVKYDLQTKLRSRSKPNEFATKPLFEPINLNILNRASYSKFIKLLDNYNREVEQSEQVTSEEEEEMKDFISTILKTTVMSKVEQFLKAKRLINQNQNFGQMMAELWFNLYPRHRRVPGSSGFEHVFVGEIKNRQISGLHNWIQYYLLEQQGKVKYQGFFSHLSLMRPVALLKYKFSWDRYTKPTSTMFVGSSPEFEIGLYTVCFFARPNEKCPIRLGDKTINIQTFEQKHKGSKFIASAYPTF